MKKQYKFCKECQSVIFRNGVEITANDRRRIEKNVEGIFHKHCFIKRLSAYANKRKLTLKI